jgi:hypothetical protein
MVYVWSNVYFANHLRAQEPNKAARSSRWVHVNPMLSHRTYFGTIAKADGEW